MNDAQVSSRTERSVAGHLLHALARRGTRRIWGVPGGGSSLDLIAGAEAEGLRFVLCRQEASAALMALADAELTGSPGAVTTTLGPGVSSAANGLACAMLERAPLVLISDAFPEAELGWVAHQVFDQRAATAAYAKGYARAAGEDAAAELEALLDLACAHPRGAVHVDMAASRAQQMVSAASLPEPHAGMPSPDLSAIRALLRQARRPVAILGLEATQPDAATAARALITALRCAALVTYKAKGVIPDEDPSFVGLFTGGALEAPCVAEADLILLLGLDPVELIPQPWRYGAPVLELAAQRFPVHPARPAASAHGPLAAMLEALTEGAAASAWTPEAIAQHRARMRDALAWTGQGGVAPPRIPEIAQEEAARAGRDPRATVDAGAHMFSATAFWRCRRPRDLLISNGLASMGFALPAAIAAALHDPVRGAVAFTGDGGLMMCLSELETAAEAQASVVTVVFNDGALSLIEVKQRQRQLPSQGLRRPRTDFAAVAEGLGVRGFRAEGEVGYRAALRQAFAHAGPSLIDVRVEPDGYLAQLRAMRG